MDAMSAIAAILDLLATHSDPRCCDTVAAALQDVSAFSKDAARRALSRYCEAVSASGTTPQVAAGGGVAAGGQMLTGA